MGILLALAAGIAIWAVDRGGVPGPLPAGAPAWARARDYLLEGPDAGAWASNAVAVWLGQITDLDPHRLPLLPYLTAAALHLYPDPALAGHLVNHLAHTLLGPVVFVLGRCWMGRGPALGAALLAVTFQPAVVAADRYGVDPLVALMLPLALLAAEGAARWPAAAPFLGMLVGAAASTHLTTIGVPLPALLLVLLRGQPGVRRWLGAAGLVAGVFLGVGAAYAQYPMLPRELFLGTLAEGVTKSNGGDDTALAAQFQRALGIVTAGGPAALERVVSFLASAMRPRWLPWGVALWLPWLGLLGLATGAPPAPGAPPRAWASWLVRGLASGLPLAAAMVPMLAFAAAGSPPRYTNNYFPLAALLMMRGLASGVGLIDLFATRLLRAWPVGLLGTGVGLAVPASLWDADRVFTPLRLPPTRLELADRRLGQILLEHFPLGGGGSCLRREVVAYAGRVYCPYSPGFDFRFDPDPIRTHLSQECSGEGPIPYVILDGYEDGADAARKRMDAWVSTHGVLVAELEDAAYGARVYAVERAPPRVPATVPGHGSPPP